MIIDLLLGVLQVVVNILLSPLKVLNFAIDVVSSISIVQQFVQVAAYIFPWSHITPLVGFIVAMFIFRSIVALIKTIWQMLPIL